MLGPYEWQLATRYLRSTQRRGFISFVSLTSIVGLTLGIAVLIVVLSVMNGFARELRTRMLSVTSHATLEGLDGDLPNWRAAQSAALREPGVTAASPYVEAQAILVHGDHVIGTRIRGVIPREERKTTGIADRLTKGRIEDLVPGAWRIVLGSALAGDLDVKVGDTIVLIVPEGTPTPVGIVPRMRRFQVSGLFHSGMYEYDSALALISMADADRVYHLCADPGVGPDCATGVRLTLADPFRAPHTVRALAIGLGGGFYISDWTKKNVNLFRSIEITKSMMFVILLMIVAVAAFNIIATLVMIVKEKQSDIAILRTLGAGPRNVLATFALQGVLIGLAGTALGAGLGVLFSHHVESAVHSLEHLLGTHFLDPRVYSMSDLPAFVEWTDVAKVCGVAFILCALATLYPAWRASRTAPAEALHHDV
ncbi:MAG TPA: lipoprotein-releasing ABC transporter permease subunit [Steroidobacteraceae bacterium]|nr:lipoprotein-releasing ABC transporter permease subunit [Steroidobacteraceae bacterium]